MFAALGVEVTVVDKRERPLEFLDGELVDELLHQMRNTGVTFRLGETVTRLDIIEEHPRRVVILLESGKRLASELVLFSAGREGATKRLNLAAAGLEADERGRLAVDQHYRTAVPHIFAEVTSSDSQPCRDISRARSPGRLSCVRGRSRTDGGTLSDRRLHHPRSVDGRRTGACVDGEENPV